MLRSYNPAKLSLQALPALIDWPELYWWVGRRWGGGQGQWRQQTPLMTDEIKKELD